MRAIKVSYLNFRNIRGASEGEPAVLSPGEGINILHGRNAQGKTNILEGIWLFTGGRSFRGAKDRETVRFGKEKAELKMDFESGGRLQEASLIVEFRRYAVINQIPQPSPNRLSGVFCGVIFSPGHLSLVKNGPEERRRFLDTAYCQVRPGYIPILGEYSRTLLQRNTLIKRLAQRRGQEADHLDIWNRRLAHAGAKLMLAREAYILKLAPKASEVYEGLSGSKEQLSVFYQPSMAADTRCSLPDLEEQLYRALTNAEGRDLAAGYTTVGPHRDDLGLEIDGSPARVYGSQGQQRSVVIALKMAEASLLREVTGEQPVALLDDVMSELDEDRQDYILNHIKDWQVFITCCEPSAVLRLKAGAVFSVSNGEITGG